TGRCSAEDALWQDHASPAEVDRLGSGYQRRPVDAGGSRGSRTLPRGLRSMSSALSVEGGVRVRERIARLLDLHEGGALVFDADGTLWTHDVGCMVFDAAIAN